MSNTAGGFVAMAMGHLLGRSDTFYDMGEPVTHHPPQSQAGDSTFHEWRCQPHGHL